MSPSQTKDELAMFTASLFWRRHQHPTQAAVFSITPRSRLVLPHLPTAGFPGQSWLQLFEMMHFGHEPLAAMAKPSQSMQLPSLKPQSGELDVYKYQH